MLLRQWSTLIFPETRGKASITCQPVVHFPEWTTGSLDFAEKQEKAPISYELVAHFPEWTTSSIDFAGKRGGGSAALDTNQGFPLKQKESA